MRGTSVLVIDCDKESLKFFTDTLFNEGFYKVLGVCAGSYVASVLDESKPDIVLLNIDIEGEDPFAILSKIKGKDKYLPIVLFGSEQSRTLAEEAITQGASSFIIKTESINKIAKHLQEEIKKKNIASDFTRSDIMIIDDDKDITKMVESFLKPQGYKCISMNDPKKAIAKIKSQPPKLVFLDIVMPGMDGIETLERIKSLDKRIRVIMVTGVSDKDICIEAIKKGASGYITKPFSLQQLQVTLTTTLFE